MNRRGSWLGLIIVLVLVNYLLVTTVWRMVGHGMAPAPTPTRTPKPTFTPPAVAMLFITPTPRSLATATLEPTPTRTMPPAPAVTIVPAEPVTPTLPSVSETVQLTPSPTPAGGTPAVARVHVVQAGEALLLIAQRYGVDVEELMRVNNLSNPDWIYAGHELIIPQPAAAPTEGPSPAITPAPAATSFVHVVQLGENLAAIAYRYGVSVEDVVKVNGLRSADWIYVGQHLIIPAGTPITATQTPTRAAGRVHVVQAGENLTWIAQRYGVSVAAIMRDNNITDPDTLYVGQSLIIP
ncbi:MAG: LysM peptidoglycan-binding domain-containing protein [Anaerolineae bacterium]